MIKIFKYAALILLLLFIAIQFVPVNRTNPPVVREIQWNSAETAGIARRACYDCHSNETVWPWYAYVAPISWRVADHVEHGRGHANFSQWDDKQEKLSEFVEVVKSGEMPLSDYLLLHPEAELSSEEIVILIEGMQISYEADPPGQN